ncbi:MarP family serine protease [Naasia lichenicola]|uniref:MarP family serine protease n=1 Tax=Naasia lichenicola TaxID=2565933 RepID=A0A4S4FP80_9MICO|nr:MarP family serine protease [Naasia lichenicola]THG32339.1 MarP family serine protease [Naasia lichenicola]
MELTTVILDIALGLMLAGYLVYGYHSGLLRSGFAILGVIVGGIAALLLVPILNTVVSQPVWRVVATIGISVGLLALGHAIGVTVGHTASKVLLRGPLQLVDRLLGAAVNLVVAALVTFMAAGGIASLGVPQLSQPIGNSAVLKVIDGAIPDPLEQILAEIRSTVTADGLPTISGLAAPSIQPTVPSLDTGTDALAAAARSVVRISGNAFACGQSQTGSGFFIAPGRVVTNAHVVSGVEEPVVETPNDGTEAGRVVYFDPEHDLAIIAVDGLATPALEIGAELAPGDSAVFDGYPLGGPFSSGGASVISVDELQVQNIYDTGTGEREVYTLAANVQQGNSGGPLLSTAGEVTGIVFAKSADTANIGYAMTVDEIATVLVGAASYSDAVSSGSCTTD